jgi:hypothetical protein
MPSSRGAISFACINSGIAGTSNAAASAYFSAESEIARHHRLRIDCDSTTIAGDHAKNGSVCEVVIGLR